jgi:hypothetical protein
MLQHGTSAAGLVEMGERLVKLQPHRDAIVKGEYKWRTTRDGLACARMCFYEGAYEAGLATYDALFTRRPGLMTALSIDSATLPGMDRYDAASLAILTGEPENQERALAWMRDHFEFAMKEYPRVLRRRHLAWILRDLNLETVRDLPGWREFFAEVRRRFEEETS